MGTSLSGLTPATTFDGLLKVGDNDPLTADLKAISTGDGTDTMLELSTTALQIGGATGMYWDNTNKRLGIATDAPSVPFEVYGGVRFRSGLNLNGSLSNSSTGKVDINNIGFFDAINNRVGIGESTPTSRLHIKGSGATGATTSLLVQNSAGTRLMEVQDGGNIFFGAGSSHYLQNGYNWFGSYYFLNTQTFRGALQNDLGSVKIADDLNVGGNADNDTGVRLQVKGSGNDATTTALLVQNSDETDLFKVENGGNVLVNEYIYPADGTTSSSIRLSANLGTRIYYSTGYIALNPNFVYNSTTYGPVFSVSNSTGDFSLNGATGAKMAIKGSAPVEDPPGSGIFTNPTALLVQNSAGNDLLKVTDDSVVSASTIYSTVSRLSYINTITNSYTVMQSHLADGSASFYNSVAVGQTTTPTARLQVKGSGNDATTTALLVQNSAGTDKFKVDDSAVSAGVSISNTINGYSSLNWYSNNVGFGLVAGGGLAAKVSNSGAFVVATGGTISHDASAVLEAQSTTKGFLPPRMTEGERNAIATPAVGLIVYQTDGAEGVYVNTSTGWKQMQLIG